MLNKIDIPGTTITLEIVDKTITITNKIEYDMQMHFRNADADTSLDTDGDVFEPLYWLDIKATPKVPTEYHTSHYQGRYGMKSIDALRNFMTPEQLKGFFLGNSLKYLLRHQKKNGLEDLKKARKNLDWLIEEMENKNEA